MKPITKRDTTPETPGLVVQTEWRDGPRTLAWERLWRAILSNLDPEPSHIDGEPFGREGDDG